jgi:hypothetical protein
MVSDYLLPWSKDLNMYWQIGKNNKFGQMDLCIVDKERTLTQTLQFRLTCPYGDLFYLPQFGSEVADYKNLKTTDIRIIIQDVTNVIKMDPRVTKCIYRDHKYDNFLKRLSIEYDLGVIGSDEIITFTIDTDTGFDPSNLKSSKEYD